MKIEIVVNENDFITKEELSLLTLNIYESIDKYIDNIDDFNRVKKITINAKLTSHRQWTIQKKHNYK